MPGNARYGVDQYVNTDCYRLHYVDVGKGHPVLMVPGSYSTYRAWDRLVARLYDRYRLLPVDYVGAGDSDKPQRGFRYTVEEQTDVLAQMIVKLGIAPTHVIGGSYGG